MPGRRHHAHAWATRLTPVLLVLALASCHSAAASPATAPTPGLLVIAEKPTTVAGYDRSCSPGHACSFGTTWSDNVAVSGGHNGCDTRNDILRRDLTDVVVDARTHGCTVLSGALHDPYSDATVDFVKGSTATVSIDHVFPLAAAWDRGAWAWTQDRRTDFANDPLNLQATTPSMNSSKGDRLPQGWMPPANRCGYSDRVQAVAIAYQLPLTDADLARMATC